MKNSFLISAILFMLSYESSVSAQIVNYGTDKKMFKNFISSGPLQVVLTGNDTLDDVIREAVTKYWKIKSFQFISSEEEKKKLSSSDFSFLKLERFDLANSFAIYNGGTDVSDTGRVFYDYFLAFAQFDSHGTDHNLVEARWKIPLLIKGLNDGLTLVQNKNLRGYGGQFIDKYTRAISADVAQLAGKTLLIPSSLKHTSSGTSVKMEIMNGYPFKYAYEEIDELQEKINSRDNSSCLLWPSDGLHRLLIVFDLSTLSPIYILRPNSYGRSSFVSDKEIDLLSQAIKGKYKLR